jgi:hypothetical protein
MYPFQGERLGEGDLCDLPQQRNHHRSRTNWTDAGVLR